jgi:GNAT superfamily N-acetyltransferase
MTRNKRQRTTPITAGPRSICHWRGDDDDDDETNAADGTPRSTGSGHQQQLTLNSFFVQGSRTKRILVATTTTRTGSSSSSQAAVPRTPATPLSPSRRLEEARTPPTVSPFSVPAAGTPPTPPPPPAATTTTKKNKQWKQVYLDCGQSAFGQQLCKKCGMLYMPGVAEDMKAHAVMCRERRFGVSWRPSSGQRVHWNSSSSKHKNKHKHKSKNNNSSSSQDDDSMILSVVVPLSKKSVSGSLEAVYDQVAQDLGMDTSSTTVMESLAGYTVWLYLRQQRVVGFVATKPISEAFQLATSTTTTKGNNNHADKNDCSSSNAAATFDHHDMSNTTDHRIPHKAMLGVAIMWTHEQFRGQGIATRLVDTARRHAFFGMVVPTHQLAFSSPTQAGWAFGQKYCAAAAAAAAAGITSTAGTVGAGAHPLLIYEYRPRSS